MENEGKSYYFLIKELHRFMFNQTLHRNRKHFLIIVYSLLVVDCKNCFKINGKKKIKMIWQSKIVRFKNFVRKTKSPFIIYADFKNILVPDDNGRQNPDVS